jgi:hypothetical protein
MPKFKVVVDRGTADSLLMRGVGVRQQEATKFQREREMTLNEERKMAQGMM